MEFPAGDQQVGSILDDRPHPGRENGAHHPELRHPEQQQPHPDDGNHDRDAELGGQQPVDGQQVAAQGADHRRGGEQAENPNQRDHLSHFAPSINQTTGSATAEIPMQAGMVTSATAATTRKYTSPLSCPAWRDAANPE